MLYSECSVSSFTDFQKLNFILSTFLKHNDVRHHCWYRCQINNVSSWGTALRRREVSLLPILKRDLRASKVETTFHHVQSSAWKQKLTINQKKITQFRIWGLKCCLHIFFLSPRAARLQRYFCLAGVFTLPQITNCLNNKCPEQWYDDSRLSSWFNVIAKIKQKEKSKCGGEMIDFIPRNLFHCIVKTNKFRSRRQA